MFPDFVSVHLLRLIWSFTDFPRNGKSSTVISGRNLLIAIQGKKILWEPCFFLRNKDEEHCSLPQISKSQNGLLKIPATII